MKIALIAAPMLIRRCPLIGLAYIASHLEALGHEVRVFDLNARPGIPEANREGPWGRWDFVAAWAGRNEAQISSWAKEILAFAPDVAAFTLWLTTQASSLILAETIRREAPSVKIVFGGPQAGFAAAKLVGTQPYLDAAVIGEGEQSFAHLLEAYEKSGKLSPVPGACVWGNGRLLDGGPRPEIPDLDALPFPDYSKFPLGSYTMEETVPISFNRGCVRRCVFCNIYESWKSYRHRSAGSLMREFAWQLDRRPTLRHFEVDVAALNLNLKIIDELCGHISSSGLKFTWAGSAVFRPDCDSARLKRMARAGLKRLDIGFESGSTAVLRRMKKGYIVEHAERMLRDCHEAGIEVNLNVIVGFPGETDHDFQLTKDFLRRNRKHISNIGPPNELYVGNNYIARHPEEFGIRLAPHDGSAWESEDGRLNQDVRRRRALELAKHAADMGIGFASNADSEPLPARSS